MKWLTLVENALHNRQQSFALLTPYLGLSVRLLVGLAAISLGADVVAHTAQPLPNPFAAYLDIFPGQPMSAVTTRGFSCQSIENYYTTPAEGRCELEPQSGIFTRIEVAGYRQRVRQIKFTLRENAVRLGDLLVMFNVPDFRAFSQTTFAFWRSYFVVLPTNNRVGINPAIAPAWSATFTLADRT